jgi:hypothetical protein
LWDGEGYQEVFHGQEQVLLFDNPLIAFIILALGAASVFTRVVGIVYTLAMFAEPLVPSQIFASAEYNIAHGFFM